MKLYLTAEPPYLMRINIKKQGEKTEFITLCETTQEKVYEFIKSLIEAKNISPFVGGNATNIEIREAKGSENGKSISLSFKGLEPKEVHSLIIKNINERINTSGFQQSTKRC